MTRFYATSLRAERTALLLLLLTVSITGVWARRAVGNRTVQQPDSSQLCLQLTGDETFHFWATSDGLPVVRSGLTYVYADIEGDSLVPTRIVAHEPAERTADEIRYIERLETKNKAMETWTERAAQRNLARASAQTTETQNSWQLNVRSIQGQRRGLVILMEYPDLKMQTQYGQAAFDRMFNQVGYNRDEHIGSVHDYFRDQSNGMLDLQFDVVGPFMAQHPMAYYGQNNDRLAYELVVEACKAADNSVDFRNYDWNNSPDKATEVTQVLVVYAGYGEAYGADESTIWQHEWTISGASRNTVSLMLDGVTIDTYACASELWGTEGTRLDGIGTACHEFSHCLGLPDMYDTTGSAFGMDHWDPMDCGDYNGTFKNASNIPAGYTSLERWFCGWLTPTVLDSPATIEQMQPLQIAPEAYVIYNDNWTDEMFLLENRQLTRWDVALPGHGMLVLHVDYNANNWTRNKFNSGSNQGCTIVPADGSLGTNANQLAGDPYPGTWRNTELTDESYPAATLRHSTASNTLLLGKPITRIAESTDGLISFAFMGGKTDGITAPWNKTDGIESDETVDVFSRSGAWLKRTTYGQWQKELKRDVYIVKSVHGTVLKLWGGSL